jgi:SAM-dependent methyltransferase
MQFNTLHLGQAKMNQRGAEYPAWICICLGAGAKTYVEVGCGVGRGLIRFREAGMPLVVGVDLCPHPPGIFEEERPGDTQIKYVYGDSSSKEVVQQVRELVGGDPDAVFIDADHSYAKSRMDYETWWPHTKLLVGFHDILMTHEDSVATFWNEVRLDVRSLELYSRDRKSVLEWQGQGALDASPDGHISGGGIGILFKDGA